MTRGKLRTTLVVTLSLLLLLLLAAPAVAGGQDASLPQDIAGADRIPWPLQFNMNYYWSGGGSGSVVWSLYRDKTFESSSGAYGTWTYIGSSKTLKVQYATGCLPLYTGTHQGGGYFVGSMACTDGSGGYGTWDASYIRTGVDVPRARGSGDASPR